MSVNFAFAVGLYNPQTVAIKTVNSIIIYRILIINTIGIIIYSGLAHEI